MGEILSIIILSLVIIYFGVVNHRDRTFFFKVINDMQNKIMAKSLPEYAATKPKIDREPDKPVTPEERMAELTAYREAEDIFPVD